MIFSSPIFFLFFATVLLAVFVLPGNRSKKVFLLGASYFFYGYWDWRFVSLIIISTVVDFIVGTRVHKSTSDAARKRWLALSVCTNLGILGFFKYCNFFIDSLAPILQQAGISTSNLNIILPVGISFYTFQTMSYTIDVYRRKLSPSDSFLNFALFVAFFPQLVAGPIVRAADFLPQLLNPICLSWKNMSVGSKLFLMGMVKKVLIADRLAHCIDHGFAHYEVWSTPTLWFIVIAYAIQIYCDFSGYSDMAIGVAKMLGFDLGINFRMPYCASNITDFWRRWHISLSTWLRDYLYIPLGGNRSGTTRTYINLMLTMTLGGLWHGASWNFVVWGILHGFALIVHKLKLELIGEKPLIPGILGWWMSWITTMVLVLVTWVFFRSPEFDQSLLMISGMFGLSDFGFIHWIYTPFIWVLLPMVVVMHYMGEKKKVDVTELKYDRFWSLALAFFVVLALIFFAPLGSTPFIYFQF